MKRDFEQAYRELAQSEAPDLWDRIEAGLSEKSTPVLTNAQANETEDAQKQKKMTMLLSYRKYVTVAAALLCVAILIPVLGRSLSGGYSSSSGATAAQNDAGASGGAEEAVAEESAQDTAGISNASAAEDAGTADMAVQDGYAKYAQTVQEDETAAAAQASKEMEETADAAADDMDAGITESSMLQSSADSRGEEDRLVADKLMSDFAKLEEDEVISHVVIRVTEVSHTELTEDIDEAGTFYTFLVEEEPTRTLAEGEQHVLFVPAWSSYAFLQDGTYEVDLGYRESEEYSFVLEGYHGERK